MKRRTSLRILALTVALGLGVWGAAFTYTAATFADGDILSAADLNTLLNGNFSDVATALDGKFDRAGGDLTGPLRIQADAESGPEDFSPLATFVVDNPAEAGSAAVFSAETDDGSAAVSIKQGGTSPVLTLKGFGAGDLIYGANADGLQFVVENDGSLRLGNQGDPSDTPILRLDAVAGTVANASGSGLPVAFGILGVDCSISLASSTSNFSSTRVVGGFPSPRCNIVIEGAGAPTDIVFDVTHRSSAFVIPRVGVDGNAVSVSFQDGGGSYSLQPFSFVAYVAN